MAPAALLLALLPATPGATRTELQASAYMVVPTPSDYRYSAEGLGYGSRGIRPDFGGELTALRGLGAWLGVGLTARFHGGSMSAPYGGLEPLGTWEAALGARVEADVFRFPRLFFWAEPALGVGWIGVTDARKSVRVWDLRGGVGLATLREASFSMRLRAGWSYAPTFADVTAMAGKFNFGGLLFALDGVFRVAR